MDPSLGKPPVNSGMITYETPYLKYYPNPSTAYGVGSGSSPGLLSGLNPDGTNIDHIDHIASPSLHEKSITFPSRSAMKNSPSTAVINIGKNNSAFKNSLVSPLLSPKPNTDTLQYSNSQSHYVLPISPTSQKHQQYQEDFPTPGVPQHSVASIETQTRDANWIRLSSKFNYGRRERSDKYSYLKDDDFI
ncbi:hypothetical protein BB560_001742 [Smittium megazygosporum]|uniref:Uncharacterized protein n=1 Tax=Smittium megazygosporum TaxID=133381 RepID=A0A2T9ZGQ4_9FUNG|nr:hypothetical protein BB560_001742 [Smittium megazygosporum]